MNGGNVPPKMYNPRHNTVLLENSWKQNKLMVNPSQSFKKFFRKVLLYSLFTLIHWPAIGEIVVDGVLNEQQWNDAKKFDQFITISPLTLDAAKYETVALVVTNKKGIYIGFKNYQPKLSDRTKRIFARDMKSIYDSTDSNQVYIGFDEGSNVGHSFIVSSANGQRDGILSPGNFSSSWDGIWTSATSADDRYWFTEIHIPWSVAPLSQKNGKRNITFMFARLVHSKSLRFAFPNTHYSKPSFIEDWVPIEVTPERTKSFDFSPYIALKHKIFSKNNPASDNDTSLGIDFNWTPILGTEIIGALKPDFGQVESDDLVINFSAIETFVDEKRLFFTNNQTIFTNVIPTRGWTRETILHTRRLGAGQDDNGSPIQIKYALKAIHQLDQMGLGVLAVQEESDGALFSNRFFSTKIKNTFGRLSFGHQLTYADIRNEYRTARVENYDFELRPNKTNRLRGALMRSELRRQGPKMSSRIADYAGWLDWFYVPDKNWEHEITAVHYGKDFDMNDMGFMLRNNYNSIFGSTSYKKTRFKEQTNLSSTETRFSFAYEENLNGQKLLKRFYLKKSWDFLSTRRVSSQIWANSASWNDLETRGNGVFKQPEKFGGSLSFSGLKEGAIFHDGNLFISHNNIQGFTKSISYDPKIYLSEDMQFTIGLKYEISNSELIWNSGNQILSTFDTSKYITNIRFDWYPTEKQELRFKLQWTSVTGDAIESFDINSSGHLFLSSHSPTDFSRSNSGIQIRYRYKIAPLSEIFVVFSRGGYYTSSFANESLSRLLNQGFVNREHEGIQLKMRYRF